MKKKASLISIAVLFLTTLISVECSRKSTDVSKSVSDKIETISTNINGQGISLEIEFTKGKKHNYPSFAIWLQDLEGNYIQTLFVTRYFATGIYGHADAGNNTWSDKSGESLRKAALPYWSYNRGIISRDSLYIPTPENPVPDAYTGATPKGDFILKTKTDQIINGKYRLLMEINQPWDWNEFWKNDKYPNNSDYKSSCQPSLVYAVVIDMNSETNEYYLNPIGHGHFAGEDGELYTDLSRHTTALQIINKIKVEIE